LNLLTLIGHCFRFVGQRVAFNGRLAGDGATLWASGPDGGLAYRVDVTLSGTATLTQALPAGY
jgi:hypothetical protein